MHMLTNAKSILTFEIGVIPWKNYTFFKGKFNEEFKYATNFLLDDKLKIEDAEKREINEEFKYATNFLLDDKLKIENAETLTYIAIKR